MLAAIVELSQSLALGASFHLTCSGASLFIQRSTVRGIGGGRVGMAGIVAGTGLRFVSKEERQTFRALGCQGSVRLLYCMRGWPWPKAGRECRCKALQTCTGLRRFGAISDRLLIAEMRCGESVAALTFACQDSIANPISRQAYQAPWPLSIWKSAGPLTQTAASSSGLGVPAGKGSRMRIEARISTFFATDSTSCSRA